MTSTATVTMRFFIFTSVRGFEIDWIAVGCSRWMGIYTSWCWQEGSSHHPRHTWRIEWEFCCANMCVWQANTAHSWFNATMFVQVSALFRGLLCVTHENNFVFISIAPLISMSFWFSIFFLSLLITWTEWKYKSSKNWSTVELTDRLCRGMACMRRDIDDDQLVSAWDGEEKRRLGCHRMMVC